MGINIQFEDLSGNPEEKLPPREGIDAPIEDDVDVVDDESEEIDVPDPEEDNDPDDPEELEDPGLAAAADSVIDEDLRREMLEMRREIQSMKTEKLERERNLAESERKTKMAALRADMVAAKESGDTNAEVDLQIQLAELTHTPTSTPQNNRADMVTIRGAKAERFAASRAWINDPSYEKENRTLLKAAEMLAESGLDPESDQFFAELGEEMDRRAPHLATRRAPTNRGKAPKAPRSNAPPGRNTKHDAMIKKLKQGALPRLTADDLRTMRQFKLDPDDKAAYREHQKTVRARILREHADNN